MTPEEKRIELQEQANELLIETTSEMSNEEIQVLIDKELGTDTKLEENESKDETVVPEEPKVSTKRVASSEREEKKADGAKMEVEIIKGYVPLDLSMLDELGFQHKLPVGLICELPVKEAKRCIKRGIASFPEDDDELDEDLG